MFRWWYGLSIAAILVIAGFMGKTIHLHITDAYSGKDYGRWTLKEGETFAIEFIHSVHNSPVRETFAVEGTAIRPIESRFSSFGAGIQSDLEEGQTLTRDGEFLLISGFNRSYKELNYIVGTVSDHLLYVHNEKISLRDQCGKNAHIKIRITRGILSYRKSR